jgi:hypothetical protein
MSVEGSSTQMPPPGYAGPMLWQHAVTSEPVSGGIITRWSMLRTT